MLFAVGGIGEKRIRVLQLLKLPRGLATPALLVRMVLQRQTLVCRVKLLGSVALINL